MVQVDERDDYGYIVSGTGTCWRCGNDGEIGEYPDVTAKNIDAILCPDCGIKVGEIGEEEITRP